MTDLVCSATACRARAVHAVVWNNPALHSPERRKVWTACDEHVQHLQDFVAVRGFHRETIGVGELTKEDG
ncbi:hypothetical protein [Kytococcus sp. Marseille-QA3725]